MVNMFLYNDSWKKPNMLNFSFPYFFSFLSSHFTSKMLRFNINSIFYHLEWFMHLKQAVVNY